jgi:hypothetical protein
VIQDGVGPVGDLPTRESEQVTALKRYVATNAS